MRLVVAGMECVEIPDISMYQGRVDAARLKASGRADAVMIKLTEGNRYEDPVARYNAQALHGEGFHLVGYHFARPDVSPNDAIAEAERVLEVADGVQIDTVCLDLEETSLGGGATADWRRAFCQHVSNLKPNHPHLLYEGAYMLGVDGRSVTPDAWVAANWGLMVPNYRWGYTNDPNVAGWTQGNWPPIPLPPGFTDAVAWQYTSSAHLPGIGGTSVDLSVFTYKWYQTFMGAVAPETPNAGKDWLDMASEEDVRRIIKEELDKQNLTIGNALAAHLGDILHGDRPAKDVLADILSTAQRDFNGIAVVVQKTGADDQLDDQGHLKGVPKAMS